MTGPGAIRASLATRGWPVAGARRGLLGYMIPVDLAALAWALMAFAGVGDRARDWGTLLLMSVLAVAFEEGSRRAARLQIRLSGQLRTDMTSVWAIAGAVALPAGDAVLLLVVVLGYDWFRHQRPAGEAMYRKTFVAATILLGCLLAGRVDHLVADSAGGLPMAASGALSVAAAIVAYTAVNRGLVSIGLLIMGVPRRALLGSMHDNLIELATLCLGGLVSLAVMNEPWLTVLVIAPMVTLQRGALVRELETAATTDAKTGLLNAIAWEQLAQREMARATREKYSLAVLIIDLDRFKTVNDRFGHLVGDAVLRGIGKSLTASMREYDTVGRFGGEEFVAVLPEADDTTALVVAERVRSHINRLNVSDLASGFDLVDDQSISVSIGVACMPVDGTELADLLHAADQALYGAKAHGRNRVQLARRGGGQIRESVAL